MFCIQVELLTGRFVATDYADRQRSEWPPHPARLFSALVAAYAADPDDEARAALQWLEGLPPPQIAASDHSARDVLTVFVPVNDLSISGSLNRAKKPSDAELATAEAMLPEHRGKQPRTFPSVTPDQPRFAFIWPEVEPPEAHRVALGRLTACVHRIGHSSSLVSVHLPEEAPPARWVPSPEGSETLRVVQPGQLAQLEEEHRMHQETQPRVMPAASQRYQDLERGVMPPAIPAARSCFSSEWIVLRRVDGDRLPLTAALALSAAVRGALLKHAPDPRAELLSGHAEDGKPSALDHMAVVPLPFVGDEHADGELKGVAILLPVPLGSPEAAPVLRAVGAWERASRVGDHAESEHPPLRVVMGRAGKVLLELSDDNLPRTLRPDTWAAPRHEWVSVTPVALDRNPGELRARRGADPAAEARRIQVVMDTAEQILRRAVSRVGLPEPVVVELSPSAQIRGGRPCRAFPGFVSGGHPRVLVHARLVFAEPVEGPVLLGAGRYSGYGLFRPIREAL